MKILASLLFILVSAECVSRFFSIPKRQQTPLAILIFLALAPLSLSLGDNLLSQSNLLLNSELAKQCLVAFSPLIVAALVFAGFQAIISMAISKELATLISVLRPVWLIGFVILVVRNITPIASAVLVESPRL